MDKTTLSDELNLPRRRFFGAAAMTIAAAQLGVMGSGNALADETQTAQLPAIKPGTNTSFGAAEADRRRPPECRIRRSRPRQRTRGHSAAWLALRHPQLRRCRAVAGLGRLPGDRPLSARLRDDALSFERHVAQRPAIGRRRSIIIALMDALKIEKATLAGFDWGARTADIIAALWPERCKALVSVSGYLIGSQAAGKVPLPPAAELQWWYQYLLRHRTRPRRLRQVPARLREAHLAARLAEVGLRRRHVRSQRGVVRQSRSRRHRHPQLPLAARPG